MMRTLNRRGYITGISKPENDKSTELFDFYCNMIIKKSDDSAYFNFA